MLLPSPSRENFYKASSVSPLVDLYLTDTLLGGGTWHVRIVILGDMNTVKKDSFFFFFLTKWLAECDQVFCKVTYHDKET